MVLAFTNEAGWFPVPEHHNTIEQILWKILTWCGESVADVAAAAYRIPSIYGKRLRHWIRGFVFCY